MYLCSSLLVTYRDIRFSTSTLNLTIVSAYITGQGCYKPYHNVCVWVVWGVGGEHEFTVPGTLHNTGVYYMFISDAGELNGTYNRQKLIITFHINVRFLKWQRKLSTQRKSHSLKRDSNQVLVQQSKILLKSIMNKAVIN